MGGDIEDAPWKALHEQAVKNGDRTYIDPATGYTVFTELSHADREYCCGNACRHCPYDHENVGKPEQLRQQAREARTRKSERKKSSNGKPA
ncbi:hypothetical protein GGI12_001778 [Dipsacomyces acuminosporus]|nr:hypothetical protein GGI12_001778 [Dipsacomyces acuminosporus]